MPLRWCDYPGCSSAAERDRGNCMICSSHRCVVHLESAFHACPSEDDDPSAFFTAYDSAKHDHLQALLDKINFDALAAVASRAHGNVRCSIPAVYTGIGMARPSINLDVVSAQMGGQNCHLDIHFDDGTVWMARLRLEEPTVLPPATQERIFISEVHTLRFLAPTQVPVPEIYYHSLERSEIGTLFMLMEKLPGKPLQWSESSAEQKSKVMEQLVDVFLELEKYPLPAGGSLSERGQVGPFVQGHMFTTPSQSIGPFDCLDESLTSIVTHELKMIENGELGTLAVDNYLTHLWRLDKAPDLVVNSTDVHFYLKHFDDKGDHILVDKHHNITGIIDWEFTSTECKELAFSSPCMMWPVDEFYNGSNQLSAEETEFAHMFQRRGREDVAQLILEGRKYQRFLFFLGATVSSQREEFEALFQGLRRAVDGQTVESYTEWRCAALSRASSNPALKRLMQRESEVQTGMAEQRSSEKT